MLKKNENRKPALLGTQNSNKMQMPARKESSEDFPYTPNNNNDPLMSPYNQDLDKYKKEQKNPNKFANNSTLATEPKDLSPK